MSSTTAEVLRATFEHLQLSGLAVGLACAIGLPLGAHLSRHRFLAGPVLGLISSIQTVPSVALLGFLIPLLGIGWKPALLALFLYSLLPIVRNTHAALDQIEPSVLDAARGMGMTPRQILWKVTLPLSLPVIMAGIRTSTVWSVGTATLAALIGAGGLGTFIFQGIAMVNTRTILLGAVPTAALALTLDVLLALAQRWATPRGLRIGRSQ